MKSGSHHSSVARWECVALASIVILSGAVRLAYWHEMRSDPALHAPFVDAEFHNYWARGIATGEWSRPEGFPNPMIPYHPFAKPPGYAYFVALIYMAAGPNFWAAVAVQMAMGLLNVVLTWWIGRWLFGRVAGLIAALIGGYWLFIYFESELVDPTLTITLTLLLALAFKRWLARPAWGAALAAGLILGALALVRSNVLPMAPLMMLGMMLAGWGRIGWKRAAGHAALLAVGTAAAIAPVTIRNNNAGGEFVLIAANGGLNLYIGNNPEANLIVPTVPGLDEMLHRVGWSHFDDLAIVRAVEQKVGRRLGYSGVSRYFTQKAMEFVREHPAQALALTMQRAVRMLGPAEYGNDMLTLDREASPLLGRLPGNFAVVFVLAMAGFAQWFAMRRRRAPNRRMMIGWIVAYLCVLYFTYIICFLEARYRAPMLPLLAMPAAYGVVNWLRLAKQKQVLQVGAWIAACAVLYAALWWPVRDFKPNRAYWHYLRATQYAAVADKERFAAELEKAYRLNPNNALITFKFSRARFYQGRKEESLELLKRALMLKPDLAEGWQDLGSAMCAAGKYAEAQEALTRAVRLNPGDQSSRDALQSAMIRRGLTPDEMQKVWESLQ
ncbi:glycosyltransferase family 39 protein [bacterium]|nr:glycosyltransferase family 39 protein [bacterium]